MSVRETSWFEAARAWPARSRPVAWLLRSLKIAVIAIGVPSASYGAYAGVIIYFGNFHPVSEGLLYRSAQPGKADIEWAAREHGIKSVLNLRGPHPGTPWYDEEAAAARAHGIALYDYGISAKRFVTAKQVVEILDIVRKAPKPLLVHCQSGSDRSGLVAALFRYVLTGVSATEADQELSLVYGHFPYLTSRSGAMDDSFWAFVRDNPAPAK